MSNFIKPCEGRISSGFRTKDRPDHHGIDIAQAGTVEIKAAANGRVMRSYRSDSYGEVIFVLHNFNGQEWETVYAHMREGSRRFKEGTNIKQGDVLGLMGNTGHSFGQHLHFEIHKGRWNINKSLAVDPLPLITPKKEVEKVEQKERDINVVSDWASKIWKEATDKGYIDGTRPGDTVTREELAAVILRLEAKLK